MQSPANDQGMKLKCPFQDNTAHIETTIMIDNSLACQYALYLLEKDVYTTYYQSFSA